MEEMKQQMQQMEMVLRITRERLREETRLQMYRVLGHQHDSSDWPHEVKQEIAAFLKKDGILAFLKSLGYEYRGSKRMRNPYDDDLPDIAITPLLRERFFTDVPAEVVNTAWLRSRQKKFAAVQKAKHTKYMKRMRADGAEQEAKRARVHDTEDVGF